MEIARKNRKPDMYFRFRYHLSVFSLFIVLASHAFAVTYEGTVRVNGKSNKITFEITEQKQTNIQIKLDNMPYGQSE
jgi:hypothetical protein